MKLTGLFKRAGLLAALACLAAIGLRADFSYDQTTRITGGMMTSVMRVAGVFSRGANEPVRTSVVVKGDRMAHIDPQSATIIDLAAETITEVNFKQKTYSVVTFAQMARLLDQMARETAKETGGSAEVSFKASVKETGQTRQISGLATREVVLTLVMEGSGKESGGKGAMTVTSNMWLARDVPGYGELQDFNRRMSQKLAWMPGSNALAQGRGDMAKAFGDLQKESAKLEGFPVLTTVAMGGVGQGQPAGQAAPAQEEPREAPSISGALKGLGLGGLGRRKKEEPKKEDQAAASGAPAGGPASLLETTTETANFSTKPADPSRLQVPAGFRQVESEMVKALR